MDAVVDIIVLGGIAVGFVAIAVTIFFRRPPKPDIDGGHAGAGGHGGSDGGGAGGDSGG